MYPELVDMNNLFSLIVNKLGSNILIDPLTNEDAVWKIINFFTQPAIVSLKSFTENPSNSINEEDIALYFKNHFEEAK